MTDCCERERESALPRPLQGETCPLNDTMASTSAASGSAQMTLDQLVQRVQSAPNAVLQLLKKFGKASSSSSSSAGQAQSGPATGTRASASSSSNSATTAGAGAQGSASHESATSTSAAPAAASHSLEGRLQDGSDPLRVLDPTLHALAYLYILYVLLLFQLQALEAWLVKRETRIAK